MTQATHTPGPWQIDEAIDRDFSADLLIRGHWVAVESKHGHEAYCAPGNAPLIAAAPAMLAALENLLRQIVETSAYDDARKGDDPGLLNDVAEARAAIAAATGAPTGEGS